MKEDDLNTLNRITMHIPFIKFLLIIQYQIVKLQKTPLFGFENRKLSSYNISRLTFTKMGVTNMAVILDNALSIDTVHLTVHTYLGFDRIKGRWNKVKGEKNKNLYSFKKALLNDELTLIYDIYSHYLTVCFSVTKVLYGENVYTMNFNDLEPLLDIMLPAIQEVTGNDHIELMDFNLKRLDLNINQIFDKEDAAKGQFATLFELFGHLVSEDDSGKGWFRIKKNESFLFCVYNKNEEMETRDADTGILARKYVMRYELRLPAESLKSKHLLNCKGHIDITMLLDSETIYNCYTNGLSLLSKELGLKVININNFDEIHDRCLEEKPYKNIEKIESYFDDIRANNIYSHSPYGNIAKYLTKNGYSEKYSPFFRNFCEPYVYTGSTGVCVIEYDFGCTDMSACIGKFKHIRCCLHDRAKHFDPHVKKPRYHLKLGNSSRSDDSDCAFINNMFYFLIKMELNRSIKLNLMHRFFF